MKQKKLIPTLLSIFFLAFVWQLIAMQIGFPAIFPSLFDLFKQVICIFGNEEFPIAVLSTILRGLLGFLLAFLLAFLAGTLAAFSSFWKTFFHPIIVLARSIPIISFILIAILWFSPSILPIFIALISMFPILYQNILTGLEHTDYKLVEMAKVFGKSRCQRYFKVYLPASKSIIYDGISTAMGFGWRAIIIGEVLAQPIHGIGTAMKQAQAFINVSELIAWTVVAVSISFIFDRIIKQIRKINWRTTLPKALNFTLNNTNQSTDCNRINTNDLNKSFNDKIIIYSFTTWFDNTTVSCIKGFSGKGKTTLLRLLSQLEKPNSGTITIPASYQMAYSFQDLRLLPWLSITENIAFGLHENHFFKQDVSNLVAFLLAKMELTDQASKYPHQLSGGQQQRVALARALAARSDVLFLDEPLTGLDSDLKIRIIDFLSDWIAAYRPVVIWATHEQVKLSAVPVREVFL